MFSLNSGYNPLFMQNQPLQTDTEHVIMEDEDH